MSTNYSAALVLLLLVSTTAAADSGSARRSPGLRPILRHSLPVADEQPPLPVGLTIVDWKQIRAEHERHRHGMFPDGKGGYHSRSHFHGWLAWFDGKGFALHPDTEPWEWGLDLVRWGYSGNEVAVPDVAEIHHNVNRLEYRRSGITEWFVNGQEGLEHGFTIARRPAGGGNELVIELKVRGDLVPTAPNGVTSVSYQTAEGGPALHYRKLLVTDARGRYLAARMTALGSVVRILVEDQHAQYPLTVDPIAQQAYLKASNTYPRDTFGYSVAISGNTMVVGAPGEQSIATGVNGDQSLARGGDPGSGAAYVFVRNGTTWSQQAYLKTSGPSSPTTAFGTSVAIAGDTVVVGGPRDRILSTGVNGGPIVFTPLGQSVGAAWVFIRTGTIWSYHAYLKPSLFQPYGPSYNFGASVAISGDTLVVAAPGESSNATGVNAPIGDGSCRLGDIGCQPGTQSNLDGGSGAAYVFVRNGSTWSQQAYLKRSNTRAGGRFTSVAISGDTVVATERGTGAYVFARSGSTWSQQAYLQPSRNSNNESDFGSAVSISGQTVVVGAPQESSDAIGVNAPLGSGGCERWDVTCQPGTQSNRSTPAAGAAYVFARSGSTWSQQAYLKASNTGPPAPGGIPTPGASWFGNSVSISGDKLVVGAYYESSNATGVNGDQSNKSALGSGAAYVFLRSGSTWSQQAYLKASNAEGDLGPFGGRPDRFGNSVSISGDSIVVGAEGEDSNANGVDGNQSDNSFPDAGAAYVFVPAAPQVVGFGYSGIVTSVGTVPASPGSPPATAPFPNGARFDLSLTVDQASFTDVNAGLRQYRWGSCTGGTIVIGGVAYPLVDGVVNVGNSSITIEANAPPPSSPSGDFRFRLSLTFAANTFSSSVVLPAGLPALSAATTNRIENLGPLAWGSFSGTVTGANTSPGNGPLAISTATLPNATASQPYNVSLARSGGACGVNWSLVSGLLPAGFNLSGGGALSSSGTPPAAPAAYPFTVRATDSLGAIATKSLTLTVVASPLSLSNLVLPVAQSGALYRAALVAQNGTNAQWSMQGTLPTGLLFSTAGEIAGTVPAGTTGQYSITLTATSGQQSATRTVPLLVFGTPQVLDPVVPFPLSLLNGVLEGSAITRSPILLSRGGRPVQGITADGVSQVLVRQPAPLGSGQVRFAFSDSSATDACAAPQSTVTDSSGGFYDPLSPPAAPGLFTNDSGVSTLLTVSPASGSAGAFVFAVFRSPIEFARSTADLNLPFRKVYLLRCHVSSNSSLPPIDVTIVRPPLFFVHGFTASARFWNSFTPLVTDSRRYGIVVFDYGQRIRDVLVDTTNIPRSGAIPTYGPNPFVSIDPQISASLTERISKTIRQSHLGIEYNARLLLNSIRSFLDSTTAKSFRGGNNPASVPVAVAQVDVVGHSMGGLVTRQVADVSPSTKFPDYLSPANFSRGYVRKLITIGTPHLGSPAAVFLMRRENDCMSQSATGVWYDENINLNSVTFRTGGTFKGGGGDLRGAGVGDANTTNPLVTANTSDTLRKLPDTIPLALIAGEAGPLVTNLNSVPDSGGKYCRTVESSPYAQFITNDRYALQYDPLALGSGQFADLRPMRSDAIVPLSSALNVGLTVDQVRSSFQQSGPSIASLAQAANGRVFANYLHGAGTNVVFPGAHLLLPDASTGIPTYVDSLLNTSVRSSIFNRNYRRYKE